MKLFTVKAGVFLFLVFLISNSCNNSDNAIDPVSNVSYKSADIQPVLKVGKGGTIWADCELFRTVGTPAHFKPGSGPFDELYNVQPAGTTFKDGVTAISESKPGDKDFNGGRWHVNVLKEGVSLDKYLNACSVEDLDLNDFTGTDIYFECPLLASRGNQHKTQ